MEFTTTPTVGQLVTTSVASRGTGVVEALSGKRALVHFPGRYLWLYISALRVVA